MKGTQAKASPYMMISLEASGDTEVHIWTPPPCAQGEEALRGHNTNKEHVDRAEVTRKDTHVTKRPSTKGTTSPRLDNHWEQETRSSHEHMELWKTNVAGWLDSKLMRRQEPPRAPSVNAFAANPPPT
jgi:hypothetical protein